VFQQNLFQEKLVHRMGTCASYRMKKKTHFETLLNGITTIGLLENQQNWWQHKHLAHKTNSNAPCLLNITNKLHGLESLSH